MNAKEKAQELVRQMLNVNESFNYDIEYMSESMAKDSALICVDEILDAFNRLEDYVSIVYWELVKIEIQAL
jgi:hypothetical protein